VIRIHLVTSPTRPGIAAENESEIPSGHDTRLTACGNRNGSHSTKFKTKGLISCTRHHTALAGYNFFASRAGGVRRRMGPWQDSPLQLERPDPLGFSERSDVSPLSDPRAARPMMFICGQSDAQDGNDGKRLRPTREEFKKRVFYSRPMSLFPVLGKRIVHEISLPCESP
jgi:hypothetical protein